MLKKRNNVYWLPGMRQVPKTPTEVLQYKFEGFLNMYQREKYLILKQCGVVIKEPITRWVD